MKSNIEKDDMGNLSKNSKTLRKFVQYSLDHPELRFWQALRNWSKVNFILKSSHFDVDMFDEKFIKKNKKTFGVGDTFYEEN